MIKPTNPHGRCTAGAAQIEGATTDYIETEESKDYANNIQLFLDDGASVIITVGFGLGEATIEAAKANPDVLFIGVDQFQRKLFLTWPGWCLCQTTLGCLYMLTKTNIVWYLVLTLSHQSSFSRRLGKWSEIHKS